MTTSTSATADSDDRSLLAEIHRLRAAAATCAARPAQPVPDEEVLLAISAAFAAQQAVTAVLLHLIQQADIRSLSKIKSSVGTAGWLADRFRISVPAARRLAKRARQVSGCPQLASALSLGQINADQAGAIATAIADLPPGTTPAITTAAETMMIAEASHLDALRLTRSAGRILEMIDPGEARRREAARAAKEHGAQTGSRPKRRLKLSHLADGGVRLAGSFDPEAAAVIGAALTRHDGAAPRLRAGHSDKRTAEQRAADALVEICELTSPPSDPGPESRPKKRAQTGPLSTPTARSGVLISLDAPRTRSGRRAAGRRRARAVDQGSAKDVNARQPLRR